VPGSRSINGSAPITSEITGAGNEKGLIPALDDVPAKKNVLFCDGGVFFLDRNLLMGAKILTISFYSII